MTSLFPIRWNMCHIGREFDAAVLEETGSAGILRVNRKVDVPRGTSKEVVKDGDWYVIHRGLVVEEGIC